MFSKKVANFTAMLNDTMQPLDMQLETLEEINKAAGFDLCNAAGPAAELLFAGDRRRLRAGRSTPAAQAVSYLMKGPEMPVSISAEVNTITFVITA